MRFPGSGGPRPAQGRAAATQLLHLHQKLIDVAHAHALGDVLAQALVGGGGGRGHGIPESASGRLHDMARVEICRRLPWQSNSM